MPTKNLHEIFGHMKNKFPHLSKIEIYEIIEQLSKYNYDDCILKPEAKVSCIFWIRLWLIKPKLIKKTPVAHLLKNKKFYGQDFYVNQHVLIPRPESELIIDYAKQFLNHNKAIKVLDLCTGSGCLGISLLRHYPNSIEKCTFADISKQALKVCKQNIRHFQLNKYSEVVCGDFIKPFIDQKKFDLIVCNPPYLDPKDSDVDPLTVLFEPPNALFAPEKGLYFYKELILNLDRIVNLKAPFMVILEIGWNQKQALEAWLAPLSHLSYTFKKDYANHWRNLIIYHKEG